MDKNIFKNWKKNLQSLQSQIKNNPKVILQPQNESLLVDPRRILLELQGKKISPIFNTKGWDHSIIFSFLRSTGKSYRKFWEQASNSESITLFKYQFLIYKRYNTFHIRNRLPQNAKGQNVSGLQGVLEILYCPQANLKKEGQTVENTRHDLPIFKKEEDDQNNFLAGELLTTQRIIPVGNEGFYLFCSRQQENPMKITQGANLQIITGPCAEGVRTRAAHLLRKICNGRPEETKKALLFLENNIAKIQEKRLEYFLQISPDDPEELDPATLAKDLHEDTNQTNLNSQYLKKGIKLELCPNTINQNSGTDYALAIYFGNNTLHEMENENNLMEFWKNIT